MKKVLLAVFIIILPFTLLSSTIVPAGNVSGPWTAAGSPYIVTGSITCGNLVVDPGVDVRFQGWGLTVYGSIRAIGTAALPITFEADDTTGFANLSSGAGGWSGIYIQGSLVDTSIFDHCIVKDTKGLITNSYAVCIADYSSPFVLQNSEIYHNYISGMSSVIIVYDNAAQIINNSIHNNYGRITGGISVSQNTGLIYGNDIFYNKGSEGAAIFCVSLAASGPIIDHNNIHHNRSELDAGGIMVQSGKATITNNNISFNHSARAGSGIYILYGHVKIFSNWVCNNSDSIYPSCGINDGGGGICINNAPYNDTAEVYNNIVANNTSYFAGGGIRVAPGGGFAIIENNHIINNSCVGGYFSGGLEIADNNYASVRNNIIYGNRGYDPFSNLDSVQILMGGWDTVAFEYNCGESSALGGVLINVNTQLTGVAATNIAVYGVNPGIVAPTLGSGVNYDATLADWHLTSSSPCIDAGTLLSLSGVPLAVDVYNDPRVMGIAIDIGAVEYPSESGIIEQSNSSISIYPNPATDFLYLKNANQMLEITITNILGNVVSSQPYGNGIDLHSFASGIYILSFIGENGNLVNEKFVKE